MTTAALAGVFDYLHAHRHAAPIISTRRRSTPSTVKTPSVDAGDYTINMWTREADVPGSTNVLASLPTAAALGLGTYYGNIDTSGDNDYFAINVTAGQVYTFTFAGGAASNRRILDPGQHGGDPDPVQRCRAVARLEPQFRKLGQLFRDPEHDHLPSRGRPRGHDGRLHAGRERRSTRRRAIRSKRSTGTAPTISIPSSSTAFRRPTSISAPPARTSARPIGQPRAGSRHQIAAVMHALAEYTPITGIQYVETTDVNQAEFRMITVDDGDLRRRFYPQDPDLRHPAGHRHLQPR